ncbi:hypothetical protein [Prosthecobacter sp.]|uniref:hypothetical protein n=1 Tax=Prosthecobacter sp. TaxID=1965333 RepID=UPI00378325AE
MMVSFAKALLRWGMRLLLPFLGWRVTVRMMHGVARGSGRKVTLLAAGRQQWSKYVSQRWFAEEPEVQSIVHVPVWRLRRHLHLQQPAADLTLVGLDLISARLFLDSDYLAVPPLVSCWMAVPQDPQVLGRESWKGESDFRRVKKRGYKSHLSQVPEDFDTFYDHFHTPYLAARHTAKLPSAPRWMLRLSFRFGWILWITEGGKKIAGDLLARQGRTLVPLVTGVLDGRQDILRRGGLAALYVLSITHAKALGCTRILLGGSQPVLQDGVLRYKSKWLDGLSAHDGLLSGNHSLFLRWNRLDGAVAELFGHTAFIHHEQGGGFSALWAYPAHLPVTAESVLREVRALRIRGLHRLRVLLPGRIPEGFDGLPELRCISIEEAERAGAGGICSLG